MLIGNFLADLGYLSPGPEFATFDVTGMLSSGTHTVSFDGFGANSGNYVVGQVDINYDGRVSQAPAPAALALIGMGLVGFGFTRRKA